MSLTTTNTYVPGRLPQRSAQQPAVWDKDDPAPTVHPNREQPRLKKKPQPKFDENSRPRKRMPRQKAPTATAQKTQKALQLSKASRTLQKARRNLPVQHKKPANKAAPKMEQVKKTARNTEQLKKSQHPFLTKDSRSSKPPGSEQLKCGGPKQTPADKRGKPRNA